MAERLLGFSAVVSVSSAISAQQLVHVVGEDASTDPDAVPVVNEDALDEQLVELAADLRRRSPVRVRAVWPAPVQSVRCS